MKRLIKVNSLPSRKGEGRRKEGEGEDVPIYRYTHKQQAQQDKHSSSSCLVPGWFICSICRCIVANVAESQVNEKKGGECKGGFRVSLVVIRIMK